MYSSNFEEVAVLQAVSGADVDTLTLIRAPFALEGAGVHLESELVRNRFSRAVSVLKLSSQTQ